MAMGMDRRSRMDLQRVRMATMTMLRMRARPTGTTVRTGLTVDSSSAPDRGSAVGSMAAELGMDTVVVMVTVARGTQSDAADMATQAVADMPVELAGTLAAGNAAATVAAGQ